MSRSKRPLVPDAELWQRVAEQVKPLKTRSPRKAAQAAPEPPARPPQAKLPQPRPPQPAPPRPNLPPRPPGPPPGAGLDRRTADRLRRGELPVAATLDLHGMTQAAAHAALERFVGESWRRDRRCLVIVTGKGRGTDDWGRPSPGVLRRMVPRWLAEPDLAWMVLATAAARPQHGGEGAFYLLLRRRREA